MEMDSFGQMRKQINESKFEANLSYRTFKYSLGFTLNEENERNRKNRVYLKFDDFTIKFQANYSK